MRSVGFSGQSHVYNLAAFALGRKRFSIQNDIDAPGVTDIELELISRIGYHVARLE